MKYKPIYPHVPKGTKPAPQVYVGGGFRQVLPGTVTGPASLKQYGQERLERTLKAQIKNKVGTAASSVGAAVSQARILGDRQMAGNLARLRQGLLDVQETLS
jgi:hypothetical protein